jgi:hypothetical protein
MADWCQAARRRHFRYWVKMPFSAKNAHPGVRRKGPDLARSGRSAGDGQSIPELESVDANVHLDGLVEHKHAIRGGVVAFNGANDCIADAFHDVLIPEIVGVGRDGAASQTGRQP